MYGADELTRVPLPGVAVDHRHEDDVDGLIAAVDALRQRLPPILRQRVAQRGVDVDG
ncbi:hypothetical protein GCM10022402_32030 [Salinactinospora qingdaonensis]|uniref:Uncharacterized protein n=1 Tax=Salinactinospora qingdaonensis TaxID=702744 RepID=A0ABP7FZ77_9ACTN